MISVENVSKNFGPIKAVDHISFKIETGEVVGFLGPNGAGKSTSMRMLTGFILPNSGDIVVDGVNIVDHPVTVQKKIGYLPESVLLYPNMIVVDFLKFAGQMRGLNKKKLKDRLIQVSKNCQLKSVLNRKIGDLSKGYRQRVGLAQALLHDPEILILDEPTVGLDPNQIIEIRELIKEIGKTKTILLSTHILSEVSATCSRVIIINRGKLVATGTPESLVSGHGQKTTYQISVRGDIESVKNKMQTLPDFINLDLHESCQNLHHIYFHTACQDDLSEKIFDLAVENGWRLSCLLKKQQTLENVFKDLTQ